MRIKPLLKTGALLLLGIVIAVFAFGPAMLERQLNEIDAHDEYLISESAQALHQSLIIGDWHADSLLWSRDLADHADRGHVDLPRLQQGNVALQMFTTVTKSPRGLNYDENAVDAPDDILSLAILQRWPLRTWSSLTERALYQADKLQELADDNPQQLVFIRSQTELSNFIQLRSSQPRLVGGLLGTEGSHALDGELENVQRLYDAGFRMMSLQHFFDNKLGGSLHGISGAGLTEFGAQVVTKINELNIVLDVSHSSEAVVSDVLALSSRPLVVSHTGFNGHCESPRNISDQLMLRIAQQGGLIAVGYWDGATCTPQPSSIAAAIQYGIGLVGEDHVALGSDFDGSVKTAMDTSELAALTQALLDIGVGETQIRKVMGGNMLKFLRAQLPIN